MKQSNYFLLFACCLLTFQAQAQFSFGVKGGYTQAWANYGNIELPEDAQISIDGFNVSLITNWQLSKRFQLIIEPGITQRGVACEPGFFPFPVFLDNDWELNYVELPIQIGFIQPIIANSLDVNCRLGGGAAYLMKGTEIIGANSETPSEIDITQTVNRLDYGIYSGIGFRKHFGKHQVLLDADFYLGLTDVDTWITSQNRSIDISLGYLFTL